MKMISMKNIFLKSFSFLTACVFAAGCIQETKPEGGTITAGQVSESAIALEGILRGLPASMNTSNTMGYYTKYGEHTDFGIGAIHLMTEFTLNDAATLGDNPYYNRFYNQAMNKGQDSRYIYCAYFWDSYYTWIKIANDVISVVNPESANADQKSFLGQALAYRASMYLDLARLFEAKPVRDEYALAHGYVLPESIIGLTVPIVTPGMSEQDAKNNPRAKREDIYAFIIKDLDDAEKYLANTAFNYTTPSLYAVYGLKARAYLEMGYWMDEHSNEYFSKAAEYARKAIDESGRTILTKDQWQDPTNGFNNGAANGSWIWGQVSSSENLGNIICFTAHISTEGTWGYAPLSHIGADRKFYDAIPDTDWRKASWLSPEFIENPESEEFKSVYKFAGSAEDRKNYIYGNSKLQIPAAVAYQNIKFRPAQGECSDYNIGNITDMCLMRIEEMYFIEAEAVAHTDFAEGKSLLEAFVKTRNPEYTCNANSLGVFLIDDLLFQKRIEFWGEGVLIYDYKRLDAGIQRGYAGTNQASVYRLNCTGRSPQWNFVITRGEFQSNNGINDATNNPDPSEKIELWKE